MRNSPAPIMFVYARPIVPSMAREIPGFANRGSHAWPAVCAWGKCYVTNEPGFCAGAAEGELLREVCVRR